MAESIEVVAVDGVGTPRIMPLVSDDGSLPASFGWGRPYQATGKGRIVNFVKQPNTEINGMAVYQQECWANDDETRFPAPRIRFEYLKPVDMPFNAPRVEL